MKTVKTVKGCDADEMADNGWMPPAVPTNQPEADGSVPERDRQAAAGWPTLDRTAISVAHSFEEADRLDREYWWTLAPQQRLAALEVSRQVINARAVSLLTEPTAARASPGVPVQQGSASGEARRAGRIPGRLTRSVRGGAPPGEAHAKREGRSPT